MTYLYIAVGAAILLGSPWIIHYGIVEPLIAWHIRRL